ncbi:hypothetical protein SNE40_015846 [Patella caerulea]|uniref:Transposase n=1 Tax=Patella caerulea TaxID=87958 RepID=A0AAN8JHV5_PATCE
MQLVLLCRETDLKYFGHEAIFGPVVNEIKDIEINGLRLSDGNIIKGTLHSIVGDNLGSHMIGGFLECFSCEYFCRYCCISKTDFHNDVSPSLGRRRTIENYEECFGELNDNPGFESYMGIKSNSLFNRLNYYHVVSGLPPCLGHDLFEGVVSYDMKLMIDFFIKSLKWFTFDKLNRHIEKFRYVGKDALDKPAPVTVSSERIGGHAVQNWVFVRLFSLIIGVYIQDVDDEVWQLYLKLKLIVELICSPTISYGQIAFLQISIDEYLENRIKCFPEHRLRPKHHFIQHYPELILKFGPLIRLWTMRFESKHSYFKECARKLKNYKHLTKTLCGRHQFLQSYYSVGSLFKDDLSDDGSLPFEPHMYSDSINNAIKAKGFNTSTRISSKIIYKGTEYKCHMMVTVNSNNIGLLFGKIQSIIIHNLMPYLIVDVYQGTPVSCFGVFSVEDYHINTLCLSISELVDPYPISVYCINGSNYISAKHHVEH